MAADFRDSLLLLFTLSDVEQEDRSCRTLDRTLDTHGTTVGRRTVLVQRWTGHWTGRWTSVQRWTHNRSVQCHGYKNIGKYSVYSIGIGHANGIVQCSCPILDTTLDNCPMFCPTLDRNIGHQLSNIRHNLSSVGKNRPILDTTCPMLDGIQMCSFHLLSKIPLRLKSLPWDFYRS